MKDSEAVGLVAAIPGRSVGLRPIEADDLPFLAAMANDREVSSSVVRWGFPVGLDDQRRWFDSAARDMTTRRFVVVRPDNERLGMGGLWEIDWHDRHAQAAIKLFPAAARRRGVGTDTLMTLMAYAFGDVGLQKLWASILDFNGPSLGAYVNKCGWKIEGVLRREAFRKGQFHDAFRVSILREEFDALPDAAEYVERIVPVDVNDKVNPPRESRA